MERIEFYKMSIEEYPNHKDKDSLIFSVKELQKEFNELESTYDNIQTESEGFRDLGIEKDLRNMYKSISLGRTYWNNPKNCKSCINWTVTMLGERCAYLKTDVYSPNDMYKHPECPVK